MYQLTLNTIERNSRILIGKGLLANTKTIQQEIAGFNCSQIMLVSNSTVIDKVGDKLSLPAHIKCLIGDGEEYKNWQTLNQVYDCLLKNKSNRDTLVIAFGGGVVGDLAGFAAATYQRGVPLVQIPTTLLSQVDSSVGGKTAINHPLGKNMIGAFYQPTLVLIDPTLLASLPQRELLAGLAEVVKYALIGDLEFSEWLFDHANRLCAGDSGLLAQAIYTSCKHKIAVVENDVHEHGVRALLNLGHSFGHAIEQYVSYKGWLHGEAVGLGMRIAADFSQASGWLDIAARNKITALLDIFGFPKTLPAGMDAEVMTNIMLLDKKNRSSHIRLVLLHAIGRAAISAKLSQAQVSGLLKQILPSYTK